MRDNFDILCEDKYESFLIPLFLTATARHAQSTQDNKFAISFQYIKKRVRNEVDFLHGVFNEVFQKLILSILIVVAGCTKSNENNNSVIS